MSLILNEIDGQLGESMVPQSWAAVALRLAPGAHGVLAHSLAHSLIQQISTESPSGAGEVLGAGDTEANENARVPVLMSSFPREEPESHCPSR